MKLMIICSCNVFSDADVRGAVDGAGRPKTPAAVYKCLGCSPSCGRCLATVKAILHENPAPQAMSREPHLRGWRSHRPQRYGTPGHISPAVHQSRAAASEEAAGRQLFAII